MQVCTQFLEMEILLDDSVGQNVELELERGGKSLTVHLTVSYLNMWTPCSYWYQAFSKFD